VYNERGAAWP